MTTTPEVITESRDPATTDQQQMPSATLGADTKGSVEQLTLALFIGVPFLALLAAIPFAWGWGMSWLDLGLMTAMYFLGCHGITIGFHRHFTHGILFHLRFAR